MSEKKQYYNKEKKREYYLKNKEKIDEFNRNYHKTYWLKNKDKINNRNKEWVKNNREKSRSYVKKWRDNNKEYSSEKDKIYRNKNKDRLVLYEKTRNSQLKIRVYNHYSNFDIKCNCCGVKELEFLSIDHINNDGKEQRKIHGHGERFYSWLIRNNFPSGFQILCMNCNFARGHDKDHICIHKKLISIDYFKEVSKK